MMIIYHMVMLLVIFRSFIYFYQTLNHSVASGLWEQNSPSSLKLWSLRLEGLLTDELAAAVSSENGIVLHSSICTWKTQHPKVPSSHWLKFGSVKKEVSKEGSQWFKKDDLVWKDQLSRYKKCQSFWKIKGRI